MCTFIGIDGTPGGWVAVYLDDEGRSDFQYACYVDDLLRCDHDRAMIDIPIGLPQSAYRRCDIEARKLVGSRVFLGARWGVWDFENHKEANESYWAAGDRGISIQLWSIRDKLQEVNTQITQTRQLKLLETHPELVFHRLTGQVLPGKKSSVGRDQRCAILRANGIDQIDHWLKRRRGTPIRSDDLIDAAACALVARQYVGKLPSGVDETDHRGIRMEIWY